MMQKSVCVVWWLALIVMGCSGTRPATLGVSHGSLAPCPATPNCVSTQSEDKARALAPIPYTSSPAEAREKLTAILKSMKRTRIVTLRDDYLHAECTTAVFRYVDDVEFYFNEAQKAIHFRSSSRVGYYDAGVNRRRMENIREQFLNP